MPSYIKTQWPILLFALFHLVIACIYMFKPAPDTTTIEGLNAVLSHMVTAGINFVGFFAWSFASFVSYLMDCVRLLEEKVDKLEERYDD